MLNKKTAPHSKRWKQPPTNIEVVKELMTFSHFGPMAQMWVMDTLGREAKRQAEAGVPNWPADCFVNAEAWHGTASEIFEKLKDLGYVK